MDTSSISSNKITLKISTPQGREMSLNKGEVLQAQVQEVGEDGSVTILVKGRSIEAFSEVPVKPGQQLLLMVDDLRQGKTYLKVVTPEMMGKIETTNITANLVGMGIAAKEENILLARKLLQHNLPVTQNNLNELSRNVSSLGGMNAKNLEIGAFALSRGISGKESLASLARFLSSTGETARLIPALERLANVLTNANADNETTSQTASIKNTASFSSSAAPPAGSSPEPENPAAPARNNTIPNQTVRDQSAGGPSPMTPNRATAQPGQSMPLFNTVIEAGNPASSNSTSGTQNKAASGNLSGLTATAADVLSTKGTEPQTVNQSSASNNSSLLQNEGKLVSNQAAVTKAVVDSEVQAAALPGSSPEASATEKSTLPGTAAALNDVEGEAFSTGSPKPAGVEKVLEASGAGVRAESPAGSQGRTATPAAVGEALTGPGGSEAGPSSAQTSIPAGEKSVVNQGESVLTAKPDGSGMTSQDTKILQPAGTAKNNVQQAAAGVRNIPADSMNENVLPQTAAGEKAVPAPVANPANQAAASSGQTTAPAANLENTALIAPGTEPSVETATVRELGGSPAQAAASQVNPDESMPAPTILSDDNKTIAGLLVDEDGADLKTAVQGKAADSEILKQNIATLLDAVRSLMEVDLQEAPDKIASKLQNSNMDKDIVKALNLLVDITKNPEIADKIPELKDFALGLNRLEKEISGQQLFNLSSRSAADNLSGYYYFAFPVKIDQEYSLCHLKINKDGRKNLKDVDKLSFVVSLNTSKLGLVLFHITWQRTGSLQLQGVAANQASSNFLNQNMGELVGKLEGLGYNVKNLGVKVSSSTDEFQVRPVLQEITESVRPLGIDVTV